MLLVPSGGLALLTSRTMPWILALSAAIACSAQAREYRYSDAHLHYVDFFQESAGMDALLERMQPAGDDRKERT